jgi:UDPglucose 6-dehydrogenase
MNIGFIGLGKLGLDCAEVFAEKYQVYGYDIYPRTSNTVQICTEPKDLVENSDWIFIAVPTPHEQGYDGSVPSSHMEPKDFGHEAVKEAIGYVNTFANKSKRVVLISTVLPGTTRRHFYSLLDKQHQFLYNPYLIAMGSVKWDFANPEMIMIGTETGDPEEMQELIDIYRPLMKNNPRYVTGTWDECEAIKIFYNTFISAKVGIANMIQDFAMKIGNINVDVVTNALAQSTMRIMGPKYMTAGMGDAGACHPRDNIALRWLAQEYDLGYDMFDTIMHAREIQAKNVANAQNKFTGDLYGMPNETPDFVKQFENTFKWKNFSWQLYRMMPGTILPSHKDTYAKFRQINGIVDPNTIWRAVVFLENWQSGHYFEIDSTNLSYWKKGDYVVWQNSVGHIAANIGETPRYTLQITGTQ